MALGPTGEAPNPCQRPADCVNGVCEAHLRLADGAVCPSNFPENPCVAAECFEGECLQSIPVANTTACGTVAARSGARFLKATAPAHIALLT